MLVSRSRPLAKKQSSRFKSNRAIFSRSVAPGTHSADEEKLSTMRQRFEAFDLDRSAIVAHAWHHSSLTPCNRNGKIDREELRQVLESLEGGSSVLFAGSWIPEDELDRVMETYDRNKDGVIGKRQLCSSSYQLNHMNIRRLR
jgi:EF hand